MSLSAFTDELAQVRTKKKEFLEQINRIIPWGEWITLIQPSYYKAERRARQQALRSGTDASHLYAGKPLRLVRRGHGDSGYVGAEKRKDAIVRNNKGKKIRYQINRRPSQIKKLSKSGQYKAKKRERAKSSVRAKVEHVFGVVKGLLKFKKTRYRGLRKQAAKFNIMFALANLILADRPCLAA